MLWVKYLILILVQVISSYFYFSRNILKTNYSINSWTAKKLVIFCCFLFVACSFACLRSTSSKMISSWTTLFCEAQTTDLSKLLGSASPCLTKFHFHWCALRRLNPHKPLVLSQYPSHLNHSLFHPALLPAHSSISLFMKESSTCLVMYKLLQFTLE